MPRARAVLKLQPSSDDPWGALAQQVRDSIRADVVRNIRMVESLDDVVGMMRSLYAHHNKGDHRSGPSDCGKGCAGGVCCYRPVTATLPEIVVVADEIAGLPEDQRERLERRVHEIAQATEGMDSAEMFEAHHGCPLLSDDGACCLYDARPLACRMIFVEDRRDCEAADRRPEFLLEHDGKAHAIGQGYRMGVQEAFVASGRSVPLRPFVHLLSEVIRRPELAERWAAGMMPNGND